MVGHDLTLFPILYDLSPLESSPTTPTGRTHTCQEASVFHRQSVTLDQTLGI